jgi:hypothetical protein
MCQMAGQAYLGLLYVALLEDLLHDLILVRGAELVLERSLTGGVEDTLVAVPVVTQLDQALGYAIACEDLLVGGEDLEATDDLGKGDGRVVLPHLNSLDVVNEDNEVLGGALEVDLGLGSVATSHDV